MQSQRRRRRSAAEWSKIVATWEASGESAAQYAPRHGLNPGMLYCWRSKLRKGTSPPEGRPRGSSEFAEVVVRSPATLSSTMEVLTPSGHSVRIRGSVDAGALRMVLQVLESC